MKRTLFSLIILFNIVGCSNDDADAIQEIVEDSVQEIVEDNVQEIVEDSVQEIVEDSVQEIVEDSVQEIVQEIVEDTVQEVVEDSVQEVVEDNVQEVVEDNVQENIEDNVVYTTEYLIEDVTYYQWFINCVTTVNLMNYGYWADRGYASLLPGGSSTTGFSWAVAEESSFWSEEPSITNEKIYYASAPEYGNNISSESIYADDLSWESYVELIDTYQSPVSIGWSGEPYGAHATLGVGYRIVGDIKYFLIYDTYTQDVVEAVSYNEYSESITGYSLWRPTSSPTEAVATPIPEMTDSAISLSKREVTFSPRLYPEFRAFHDYEYADINNDGFKDILIVNSTNYTSYKLWIYYGDGNNNYTLERDFTPDVSSGEVWQVVKIFDVDNDGDLDAVVTGYWTGVYVFKNNGKGLESEYTDVDNEGRGFITLDYADIDNDGDYDLAASVAEGVVRIYLNDNGTFTQSKELNLGTQSFKLKFSDINNDGSMDLIASLRNGTVAVFNNNKGVFSDSPDFLPEGHGGMSLDVGDIDNDGWKDIVSVNDGQLILYKNVEGVFTDSPILIESPYGYPKDISLNDLNSDGLPELLVGNFKGYNFILENKSGSFNEKALWAADQENPSFTVNVFDNEDDTKMIVFGKSTGGTVEFFDTSK
ncbi:FG-GAP-like repeat-containing protein [Psychromonas sp.]|nr:FG-GAP-like repeat-containing protein [Psychromonas sp.]